MAASSAVRHFCRNIPNIAKIRIPLSTSSPLREIHTSTRCNLREIKEETQADITVVEGIKVKSDRADNVIKDTCLCKLELDMKYTDVLILSQFLRPDGCMLPRHVTGVCAYQQKNLKKLIHKAQRAGLMPNLRPDRRDGKQRQGPMSSWKWKKYNVYFE
ncbi:hypothetical protein ScPMuIL_013515 [Solemya velum]